MTETLLQRRARLLGPNLPTFYEEPVHLVRGDGVWLWDVEGRRYLDCYNNVPHVGHGNPRVVAAIAEQAATLNTHTRYLHEALLDYVERLTATMGPGLDMGLLTCTGSEANDIALRMAEAVTGGRGIITTDYTYHGNTALVSQLSRSNAPDVGYGLDRFVRYVPAPDSYRESPSDVFAAEVEAQIAAHKADGHGFSALLVCPHFVNEGFPDLPPGWLAPAIEAVHRAGGVFIADEVQPGFGRLGSHMWGHQRQGVAPDIVTLGKPMANGHPVGGVVTSRDIMSAFRQGFSYFNTFGGNPVSCAAALAVLDELEAEGLMAKAEAVGAYAVERLRALSKTRPWIGDVRGQGLLFGAEMVSDPATKAPATDYVKSVVNALRHRGVLLSSLGRYRSMLKIRPPMPFDREHVDLLIDTLEQVLDDLRPPL